MLQSCSFVHYPDRDVSVLLRVLTVHSKLFLARRNISKSHETSGACLGTRRDPRTSRECWGRCVKNRSSPVLKFCFLESKFQYIHKRQINNKLRMGVLKLQLFRCKDLCRRKTPCYVCLIAVNTIVIWFPWLYVFRVFL